MAQSVDFSSYAKKYSERDVTPIARFAHDHPHIISVGKAALLALSAAAIRQGIKNSSVYFFVGGLAVAAIEIVASKILFPVFAPRPHSVKHHTFTEGTVNGVTLKYEGDLPVLEIPYQLSSREAGFAHGYLAADRIYDLVRQHQFLLHSVSRMPRAAALQQSLGLIKRHIPGIYMEELAGIVAGYNAKREEWRFFQGNPLKLEDVLLLHLLADRNHFNFSEIEKWAKRTKNPWHSLSVDPSIACTVVIDGDNRTGPVVGRNLDWATLEVIGPSALAFRRKDTFSLGIAGFVGFVSFENTSGLWGAVNVCDGMTDFPEGIPMVFYTRMVAESCKSVDDVRTFIKQLQPLGPYHLSVADPKRAETIHLLQEKERGNHIRAWEAGKAVITTNYRYSSKGGRSSCTPQRSDSCDRREKALYAYYKALRTTPTADYRTKIRESLRITNVNMRSTMQAMVLKPGKGVWLINLDNGYAADGPLFPVYLFPKKLKV